MTGGETADAALGLPPGVLLGCIADDLTGAADLSGTLVREGMRVTQVVGVPAGPLADMIAPGTNAVVVALKTRSVPAAQAVRQSLRALARLRELDCRHLYFKYCSTFDSTPAGNIGPVLDALLAELSEEAAVVCPAFPANGRTVYAGHLFVNGRLLAETEMRYHPLNPMTDSDVCRMLVRQSTRRVGLLGYATIRAGPAAIGAEWRRLSAEGVQLIVADALGDAHLTVLADALADQRLLSGGSALGGALGATWRARSTYQPQRPPALRTSRGRHGAVISGSCSPVTQRQIDDVSAAYSTYAIDWTTSPDKAVAAAVDWAMREIGRGPVVIHSDPASREARPVGDPTARPAGQAIEEVLGRIAVGLVNRGIEHLVVAGGETSGEVVRALGVRSLIVGREIETGVPLAMSLTGPPVTLVLKSGNFGSPSFFRKALGEGDC